MEIIIYTFCVLNTCLSITLFANLVSISKTLLNLVRAIDTYIKLNK